MADESNIKAHPAVLQIFASRIKLEQQSSERWLGLCPFHPDKNPSFSVGCDENKEWCGHCFSCSWGGDAISFIQKFDKISFSKAKKLIEDATQGSWEETKKQVDRVFRPLELGEIKPDKSYTLQDYAKLELNLYNEPKVQEWLFTERGITYETAKSLHFGYKQSLDWVAKMSDTSTAAIWDKGWIAFPAIQDGVVTAIEYRSIVAKKFVRQPGMSKKALWGMDDISTLNPVYVVEGKFDQAILVQSGIRHVVSLASASAGLTPEQRDKIMSASTVLLAGDSDAVGGNRMSKLHAEFGDKAYRIQWESVKDANQCFLETANRDISSFRKILDTLTLRAYANPLPGVQSIQDILWNDDSELLLNHPERYQHPWKNVDQMAIILPGSVVQVSASASNAGKTPWVVQTTLHNARKRDQIVINYQCELSGPELGQIVTAMVLAKDRNEITKEDRLNVARKLKGVQYYVGSDPNLNTSTAVLDLLESAIRRLGATVVVLDHIHFICRNSKNETQEQANAMQRIKRMAQKYHLVFFVVGQTRKVESKMQGKELQLYDSKGSETIISDSDVVFQIHRETLKNVDVDNPPIDKLSPETLIICMKARNRAGGGAYGKLYFLGKIATFTEVTKVQEPEPERAFDW